LPSSASTDRVPMYLRLATLKSPRTHRPPLYSTSLSSLEAAFPATVRYLTFHVTPPDTSPEFPPERDCRRHPPEGRSTAVDPLLLGTGNDHPCLRSTRHSFRNASRRPTVPKVQAPWCSSDVALARVPSKLPHPLHRRAPRTFAPTISSAFSSASSP
jgi:hypothetical protein